MKKAIRDFLLTKSAVTALVSTRIYSEAVPQKATYPLLVISQIDSETDHHLTGASGRRESTWELEIQSTTDLSAEPIKEAIRLNFDTYAGTMGAQTVKSITLTDEDSDVYEKMEGAPDKIFARVLTFRIVSTESIPTP